MAKPIMIVGTMSSAGKSFITAGLCRIFRQDGYKVAPFKSQNMALNSYITDQGLEMGRAQVMQAEAAGIAPSVHMNPILLKPTNDKGSQVIVNGEVLGNMSAADYYKMKHTLIPHIQAAYDTLSQENDIIVIEGAGSPAEINLKSCDIVNMGLAKLVDAPVLLVGDIDRGGVFASLAGTMLLLDEEEKARIKGVIINKFRGDVEILKPGLDMLTDIIHRPVVGVVPMTDVVLDDEDSLSEGLKAHTTAGAIEIAVVRLPKISNFTDFTVFTLMPQVSLRYVSSPNQLGNPDLVILPGTKNTMADLKWLRESGMEAKIKQYTAKGGVVFGVCGGYQMLGQELHDPLGIEEGGSMVGIGLLDTVTTFAPAKIRTQVAGHFGKLEGVLCTLSGAALSGYEIHMGISESREAPLTTLNPLTGDQQPKPDGSSKGNVYGSYVHGIFDSEQAARGVVNALATHKGIDLSEIESLDLGSYKEQQYNKLADALRASLDLEEIYKILGIEKKEDICKI